MTIERVKELAKAADLAAVSMTDIAGNQWTLIGAGELVGVERMVSSPENAPENTELKTWAERFDAKLDQLTARQDAFLKYLELQTHRA
jgi:hypothetical protein